MDSNNSPPPHHRATAALIRSCILRQAAHSHFGKVCIDRISSRHALSTRARPQIVHRRESELHLHKRWPTAPASPLSLSLSLSLNCSPPPPLPSFPSPLLQALAAHLPQPFQPRRERLTCARTSINLWPPLSSLRARSRCSSLENSRPPPLPVEKNPSRRRRASAHPAPPCFSPPPLLACFPPTRPALGDSGRFRARARRTVGGPMPVVGNEGSHHNNPHWLLAGPCRSTGGAQASQLLIGIH